MYITLVILLHPPKIRSAFAENFSWKQVFYVLVQENVRYLLQKLHDLPEALQYNKPFFALDYHAVEISRKGKGADDRSEKVDTQSPRLRWGENLSDFILENGEMKPIFAGHGIRLRFARSRAMAGG